MRTVFIQTWTKYWYCDSHFESMKPNGWHKKLGKLICCLKSVEQIRKKDVLFSQESVWRDKQQKNDHDENVKIPLSSFQITNYIIVLF